MKVDPRVCGGAPQPEGICLHPTGRSPRVRGSQIDDLDVFRQVGSIPACAGEPPFETGGIESREVDPRVCGGATRCVFSPSFSSGRSPRVRGSQAGKRE